MSKNKQLNVLHIAAIQNPSSGMLRQFEMEHAAAQSLNLPWICRFYCSKGSVESNETIVFDSKNSPSNNAFLFLRIISLLLFRIRFYRWLYKTGREFDIILCRYYVHDPVQAIFSLAMKDKVMFVHHTKEIPELLSLGGFIGPCRSILDRFIGRSTLRNKKCFISLTQEIARFQLKHRYSNASYINYPNGIFYGNSQVTDLRDNNNVPVILFVANFMPWHGLDLLLLSVKNSKANFKLHIAGNVNYPIKNNLLKDHRVIFLGNKSTECINTLIAEAWVGISTLALSRKDMTEACSLKVREYLRSGLPVYGEKDVFEKEYFYYEGVADIDTIINYAKKMRPIRKLKISNDARIYIDKETLLLELYNELKNAYKNELAS